MAHKSTSRAVPATVMIIVSTVLVFAIYLQVRFRWQDPEITSAVQAEHSTTGVVARNAGARLSPTDSKLAVEPTPAGPKPAQPADHPAPENGG